MEEESGCSGRGPWEIDGGGQSRHFYDPSSRKGPYEPGSLRTPKPPPGQWPTGGNNLDQLTLDGIKSFRSRR